MQVTLLTGLESFASDPNFTLSFEKKEMEEAKSAYEVRPTSKLLSPLC
jgi:hypothetical protein